MDDIDKIRETFFKEAHEILHNLEGLLLDLENDPENTDLLNAVFREMHTLKGSSGMVECHSVERFVHMLEDLLDLLRDEKIEPTQEVIDILFESCDATRVMVDMVKEGEETDDNLHIHLEERIRSFLPEREKVEVVVVKRAKDGGICKEFINSLSENARGKVLQAVEEGKRTYQIGIRLSRECLTQGIDPLMLIKSLSYEGEIFEVKADLDNVPPLNELQPELLYIEDIILLYGSALGIDELDDLFEFAHEAGDIQIHQFTPRELKDLFDIEFDEFWLETAEGGGQEEELKAATALDPEIFYSETFDRLADLERRLANLDEARDDGETIDTIFRHFHTIGGNARIHNFPETDHIAHFAETLLEKVRSQGVEVTPYLIEALRKAADEIKGIIGIRSGKEEGKVEGVAARRLGEILVEMGELTEEQLRDALEKQQRALGSILVQEGMVGKEKLEEALEKQKRMGVAPPAALRVDTDKIDSLVNLVGELVITQTMLSHSGALSQVSDQGLLKIISQLEKISRDIQGQVMSIRMLPIKSTFQKLTRAGRDISRKAGKELEIKVSGEETELDKTVIDEIGDPLVHIMRNALDHGIEHPEARVKAGKTKRGLIELKAFHQGGNIVIEVRDDGRGLDRDAILKKAIERGLAGTGEELSDNRIYDFIFEPGFSTATEVTDVSGRGVGMDVVRKNVEKLRGKVDIHTVEGEGTTFTMRLPLTLAIIDGMVVQVGKERYIIPTISIVESLRPKKSEIITVKGKGEIVKVREDLFPLVRLHNHFNVPPMRENPWEAMVILVEGEGRRACLLVDELIGQQQVVIKSLGESFKKIRYISGGAIMGDGRVGLILDTGAIIAVSTA